MVTLFHTKNLNKNLVIDDSTNKVNSSWTYITADNLNFLAVGETLTFSYTITATDDNSLSSSASETQTVTITITGTNDAPTVDTKNVDEKDLPFAEDYNKDISNLFSDKDSTDILTYEASNLPTGLSIDKNTGVISGKTSQSGEFVIVLKATDTAGASITRTYTMQITAPVQRSEDVPTPSTNPNTPENPQGDNTGDTGLNNFDNDSNDTSGVLDSVSDGANIVDPGVGFLDTSDSLNNTLGNDLNSDSTDLNTQNSEQSSQTDGVLKDSSEEPLQKETSDVNSEGSVDDKSNKQANVNLNVLTNGQVTFDQDNQDAFSVVGITIEDISFQDDYIEIKVVDTSFSQNFVVTQIDGTPLPTGLFFDPKTGNITGKVPADIEELKISIKAINSDGTTRVLNLTLDLKELKKANQISQIDTEDRFVGLKEQIEIENKNLDGYGSYLTKLFA